MGRMVRARHDSREPENGMDDQQASIAHVARATSVVEGTCVVQAARGSALTSNVLAKAKTKSSAGDLVLGSRRKVNFGSRQRQGSLIPPCYVVTSRAWLGHVDELARARAGLPTGLGRGTRVPRNASAWLTGI